MKKAISLLLVAVFLMLTLSSCTILANHMRTEPLILVDLDGETYFLSNSWEEYKIDFEEKTISEVENDALPDFDDEKEARNVLVFKKNQIAQYGSSIENKALQTHLESCELANRDNSIVYAYGYWQEDILVGFVQVYKMPALGRATYAVEEIDHSLLFSYDPNTDTFTVTQKIEDVAIVAFDKDTVIYWKHKAYYAYDLQTDAETYLVEDKAYDGGPTSYSIPIIYFNEDMCIFYLYKRPGDSTQDKEYVYVFDFSKDAFFELTWKGIPV